MVNDNNNSSMFRVGDLVIGSSDPGKSVYSASGTKIIEDGVTIYGDERSLKNQGNELIQSALRSGGKLIPTINNSPLKKRGTKKKTTVPRNQYQGYADPYSAFDPGLESYAQTFLKNDVVDQQAVVELKTVQFENSFGRMKSKVEHLIEHDQAFMLIFSDEDSVLFEPKIGEALKLHTPSRQVYDVYYPGVTFDSPDNDKKFMILFKVPEENQE